jgi:hypothetical protein
MISMGSISPCDRAGLGEYCLRFEPPPATMSTERWLDPVTGLPPTKPYTEFEPAPNSPRPLYRNVWITGWLATRSDSEFVLAGIKVSGVGAHKLLLLNESTLAVGFGPGFAKDLAELAVGSAISIECVVSGWTAAHLRNTDYRARGSLIRVFWVKAPT